MGNIHVKLFEIWTSGSGDLFKEKVFRTTDRRSTDARLAHDGQRPITIAHLKPSAQVS